MISSLLEGISGGTGEKIAGDWLERLFGPALLFWGGGLLLVSFFSWLNPLLYFFGANTNQQISLGLAFIVLVVLLGISHFVWISARSPSPGLSQRIRRGGSC